MHGVVEKIYFYYSFGFLIFRTVAVSLYAASINEESKGPLTVLYSVPSNVYNEEVSLCCKIIIIVIRILIRILFAFYLQYICVMFVTDKEIDLAN